MSVAPQIPDRKWKSHWSYSCFKSHQNCRHTPHLVSTLKLLSKLNTGTCLGPSQYIFTISGILSSTRFNVFLWNSGVKNWVLVMCCVNNRDLHGNGLSGEIPANLSQFQFLTYLWAFLATPSIEWIGNSISGLVIQIFNQLYTYMSILSITDMR